MRRWNGCDTAASFKASDIIVKMVVALVMSKDAFDDTKQLAFRNGIADAADVGMDKVKIAKIEEMTTRRRHLLAANSIKIDIEVAAKDANTASSVANNLNANNVNAQLSKTSLPDVQVLSAATSGTAAAVAASAVPTSGAAAAVAASAVPTSGAATAAGSVGLAALAALCARQASGV